jgi:hypothetical protein
VLAALALTRLVNTAPVRRWGALVTGVVLTAAVALLIDGLANGWPPYWERLPGPHEVSSFESSVNPQEIAISNWTLQNLGPGNRITADQGIYPVLIGYGGQNALQDISQLYHTPTWTAAVAGFAQANEVQYVETDKRTAEEIPVGGNVIFPGDMTAPTKPLPLVNLTKYNSVVGAARVYDDGTINIYDIQSQGYVVQPTPKP